MRITTCALVALAFLGCKRGDGDRDRYDESLVETARACAKDGELSCPRPILSVASLRASQAYYRDALGFEVRWDHGDPPDFGAVGRSGTELFMCQGCQGPTGAWVMVFAHDVDALHEELRRRGAIIRMPPTDMPWGLREMHVADPDGNVLRFGSHGEH